MSERQQRITKWMGAALGLVCACLCWFVVTRKPPSGPSEEQARQMGFVSSSRYNAVLALGHNNNRLHDADDAQFALIADVLQKDGMKPRIMAVVGLNALKSVEQKRRAVGLMKPHVREEGVGSMIYFVLQTYAGGNGRVVVEEMARDADPNARAVAATVLHNVPARRHAAQTSALRHSQGS